MNKDELQELANHVGTNWDKRERIVQMIMEIMRAFRTARCTEVEAREFLMAIIKEP